MTNRLVMYQRLDRTYQDGAGEWRLVINNVSYSMGEVQLFKAGDLLRITIEPVPPAPPYEPSPQPNPQGDTNGTP